MGDETAVREGMYLPPLVIGGGNMARAIVGGAAQRGLAVFRGGWVAEPDVGKHGAFVACGMRTYSSISAAIDAVYANHAVAAMRDEAPVLPVLLAIKPQMLAGVVSEISGRLEPKAIGCDVLVTSILAGMPIDRISLAFAGARVVRVMPNLAASVGEGATAISRSAASTARDLAYVRAIFEGVGPLVIELHEPMMDAFTALAGSGPAYLFYLAEAMMLAGEAMGLEPEVSRAITRQTIIGAARVLGETSELPSALRAAVTSKGGTTAAAMGVLDGRGVMDAWIEAIRTARDRGRELGQ